MERQNYVRLYDTICEKLLPTENRQVANLSRCQMIRNLYELYYIFYSGYASGRAIHRSRVRVLAGHHCVVALGKQLAPVCLCHKAV